MNYCFVLFQIQLYFGADQLILSFPHTRTACQNSDAGRVSIFKPSSSGEPPFCLIHPHVSGGHNSIDFPCIVFGIRPALRARSFGFQCIYFEAIRLYVHVSLVRLYISDEHDEILPAVHFHLIGGNVDGGLAV